jgi:diacylglycerol kinase family enzyme
MPVATCVIYNPAAGRGRAEKLLNALRSEAGLELELRPSREPGHAVELAREAAEEGYPRVVAAGGDGTVHEVANGLLRADRRDSVLSVWPIGSANDYAFSLGMDVWWARRGEKLPTEVREVDVGRVTAAGRERFVVCCFGAGFNGMVTVESRKTHWLAGMPLYAWAFVKAMVRHFATPVMTLTFDGREVTTPTLSISVLNAQREGNFPLRPDADLSDGVLDYMHATRLTRWNLLRFLPQMASGRLPPNHRLLRFGRARRITVRSEAALCVHADGEFVCVPEDGIREVAVEVVPRRLKVEVYAPFLNGGRKCKGTPAGVPS